MADLVSYGNPERDVEQALIALKKGSQLIKYSRKGKPKLCPFRVSTDETTLIWLSRGEERHLKLASVCRIIPGQRTAVFRRYLRPEKDYLSFSLLYNNGQRSLDLICKDKAEAEVWFAGLKALSSTSHRRKINGQTDAFSDGGGDFIRNVSPLRTSLDITSTISHTQSTKALFDIYRRQHSFSSTRSDVVSDNANMQLRSSTGDALRISISSAPSSSSQGSGPDDCESLGDVYVWGLVWCDGIDGSENSCSKVDVLLPRPLESNVVLDVHQIACGVRHAALVTRQGEVFTWGEESGGRLGHGNEADVSHPQLVESLVACNVDYMSCGEYHTCAISFSGDLFTWGDGKQSTGLLGHGTDASHWIPKRVSGPLEGLHVMFVACGIWHTALSTSCGKLFTYGEGTFGALGHGNRESIVCPREVESLSGLKTIKVACGLWHTAAIVEVMGQVGTNVVPRKLFTWGDGDKNSLGQGDKEPRLVPTCVPSLIDYNFHQLACGHSITIGLTTTGHVFTMGSTVHGQLGNPQYDGSMPCLVQDRLVGEVVEEIACGAYHVAVLTSRNEIYTWGKGANGRLGLGDAQDRTTPTLIEALKDRHVKSISCGSDFTASICIHKWVSGVDQSVCSGCRQAFGFTRKRHNCYNCGLVHCHACSSKKVLRAALAPTPGKPHRVCDSCYAKLKGSESGYALTSNKKRMVPRRSIDTREKSEYGEIRPSRILFLPRTEPVKYLEFKSTKQGSKMDSPSLVRASQVPSFLLLKDIGFSSSVSAVQTTLKPVATSMPSPPNSRPTSPYSRRPSPTHAVSPMFSESIIDSLKKTNEFLNLEVLKLQAQVKSFQQRCGLKDVEVEKYERKAKKSASLATEVSSKYTATLEVIRSLVVQLKDIVEKQEPDVNYLRAMLIDAESLLIAKEINISESAIPLTSTTPAEDQMEDPGYGVDLPPNTVVCSSRDHSEEKIVDTSCNIPHVLDSKEVLPTDNEPRSPQMSTSIHNNDGREIIEQFEPGVYITVVLLHNGIKAFKRVKFSKRRFAEQQAEDWWRQNKDRVFKKYSNRGMDSSHSPYTQLKTASAAEEDDVVPSHP
uniref:Putative E3 ubiquitin-protein ligase HERC1 n=2 Tax=Anthurium amnicola TaxID=1678845 RepID=A0A1D1XSZ4_9ARAE